MMNAMSVMNCAALAIVALAVGCVSERTGQGARASRVRPRHVIMVGWDGFAANTLADANVPTLRRMMAEGAWTDSSRSILPSSSACNWRSLFTCSASEQHGYLSWDSKGPAFPPADTPEGKVYPDIFQCLRRERPDAEVGIIYEWAGIAGTMDVSACSYHEQLADTNILTAACSYIRKKKPTFLAICYDAPDHQGHRAGWGSAEYHKRLTRLDRELDAILAAVREAGMEDETVIMVTSDHGGTGKGHGKATLAEMERPVFLMGKGVRRGVKMTYGGAIYDTGATLAALLDITPPRAWIGRPLDEGFEERK